mgnify:CR=1 FL=1
MMMMMPQSFTHPFAIRLSFCIPLCSFRGRVPAAFEPNSVLDFVPPYTKRFPVRSTRIVRI